MIYSILCFLNASIILNVKVVPNDIFKYGGEIHSRLDDDDDDNTSDNYNADAGVLRKADELLFISYKFVKGFLAITFYYLLFLVETFMTCVNIFYITRNKI